MQTLNPLFAQFRAATKVVVNWVVAHPDTSFSGALVGAGFGLIGPDAALLIAAVREFSRSTKWRDSDKLVLVGARSQPVDNRQLALSAVAMATFIAAGAAVTNNSEGATAVALAASGAGVVLTMEAGGLRAIWDAYSKVMWDHPRKDDDGGPTMLQRLQDGVENLTARAAGLLPQPQRPLIPVPIPAPSQTRLRR